MSTRADSGNVLLQEAVRLQSMGLSVIPIKDGKKPAVASWLKLQSLAADQKLISNWFTKSNVTGLGIILGPVSGHLAVRDFDDNTAFEAWSSSNPELAQTLPIVQTQRGKHVFARIQDCPNAKYHDGELRAAGTYVVAPPSRHLEGALYRWERGFDSLDDVPWLSVEESGFGQKWGCEVKKTPVPTSLNHDLSSPQCSSVILRTHLSSLASPSSLSTTIKGGGRTGEDSSNQEELQPKHDFSSHPTSLLMTHDLWEVTPWIREAISQTIPKDSGQRNGAIFSFARLLQSRPEYADAHPSDLVAIVRAWHQEALPYIGTKGFDETRVDFNRGWPKVKYPHGSGPFADALRRVDEYGIPLEAHRYDDPRIRRLVGLCRELQRGSSNGCFFLGCRTAGQHLGVSHTAANGWLFLLCEDHILQVVEKGKQGHATRYRYVLPFR